MRPPLTPCRLICIGYGAPISTLLEVVKGWDGPTIKRHHTTPLNGKGWAVIKIIMKGITFEKKFVVEKVEKGKREKDLLGDALSAFFGKKLYWVHRKYNPARVQRALHLAEKENDKDFTHFMQNVLKG